MAKIPGLNITAPVVPSQDTDTYPSHRAIYGYGGWREVSTVAERDAIPELRREAGMAVYVTSEKKLYILNSDLVTWSLFSAGGVVVMPTPNETELGNIVQYIGETTENYTQGYFYKCISDGADPASYSWEQIDVQPATDLIWGNIEGTLSEQTDLQEALDAKQDTLTAGTNITIENNVISSTASESFFRGPFTTWTNVPATGSESNYLIDIHGSHIPQPTDFITIADTSDYVSSEPLGTIVAYMNSMSLVTSVNSGVEVTHPAIDGEYYIDEPTSGEHIFRVVSQAQYASDVHKLYAAKTIVYDGNTYAVGDLVKSFNRSEAGGDQRSTFNYYAVYSGAWRFYYDVNSVWGTDGKLGWKPQYQIENVLPIANSTEPGITKLYTTTGSNTDGTMDQKSITDAINNVSETFYRGQFINWSNVPTNIGLYEKDIHNSRIPTPTDFIIVSDASDFEGSDIDVFTPDNYTVINEYWNLSDFLPVTPGTYINYYYHRSYTAAAQTQIELYDQNKVKLTTLNCQVTTGTGDYHDDFTIGNNIYYIKVRFLSDGRDSDIHVYTFATSGVYQGAWRFYYKVDGSWSVDGKKGWIPQYQIENTLPLADDQTLGIAKLYQSTGTNTDGAISQKGVTDKVEDLQEQIDSLSGRGRYLTLWNCSTGLAETNPPESPYEYHTGDYFIVGTVAESGGTNYKPDGTSYTTGAASTVEETEEVDIDDTYIFDGTTWHLQYNSQKTVSFANIAGSPYDNTNLANTLNAKQDLLTNASNAGEGIIIDDVTQEISTNNIVWRKW